MTNTERGFLDDIIANPEDDTPRLIYADWLEDHDWRPAGRFIRTQIAGDVASLPLSWSASVIDAFCGLGLGYRGSVTNGLGQSSWRKKDGSVVCLFRRGFLAEIHGPLDMLLEHLPRLVREHPIEAVRVTDKEPFEGVAGILGGGRFVVGWHPLIDPADPRRTDELHRSIFDLLIPGIASRFGRGKYYPTADAAHAALSVALLKRARMGMAEVKS